MNVAQLRHRRADQLALDDVAGRLGVLDEVVDERVDPPRPGVAEDLDRLAGGRSAAVITPALTASSMSWLM